MKRENSFQKVKLGEGALTYVKERSDRGELGKCVIRSIDLSQGTVFTWLPKGWDAKRLDNINLKAPLTSPKEIEAKKIEISSGSIVLMDDSMNKPTYDYVQSYLQSNGGTLIIWDMDYLPAYYKPEEGPNSFFFNSQVYAFATSQNNLREKISKCFTQTAPWSLFGVLTSYDKPLPTAQQVDYSVIEEISSGVDAIIVGAFDGDGYIFWERNPHSK
jgi:hypothetical protein